MRLILTASLFAVGLLFLFLGAGFMINPETAAGDFGLVPSGTMGLASLRADFTAFFIVGGGCMVWGAWKRNGDPLLISAALFGIAFAGRAVNLVLLGAYTGYWQPMMVEALAVALSLSGSRALPHVAINHEDD